MNLYRLVLCAAVAIGLCFPARAAEGVSLLADRAPASAPLLLVLGTAHLSNPGRDAVNVQVENILTERRQTEIAALVEQLAAFRPTHIAVEWREDDQATLDARYRDYRAGRRVLEARESDQFAQRLAARLGLPAVYAVDWNGAPPGDPAAYDWPAFGQANGFGPQIAAITDPARSLGQELGNRTVTAWLLELNRPERLAAENRVYFDIALIANATQKPGANWVGHWHARNLRIFGNLVRLASRPTDRLLVIYGAGHAYLLRQFAAESGAFRLVEVDTVLKRQ